MSESEFTVPDAIDRDSAVAIFHRADLEVTAVGWHPRQLALVVDAGKGPVLAAQIAWTGREPWTVRWVDPPPLRTAGLPGFRSDVATVVAYLHGYLIEGRERDPRLAVWVNRDAVVIGRTGTLRLRKGDA
jgi:hypothetical protein